MLYLRPLALIPKLVPLYKAALILTRLQDLPKQLELSESMIFPLALRQACVAFKPVWSKF